MINIMSNNEVRVKNNGFTLAEVLITLGIIGIIAAMTLPTLIQKQQEKIKVTQLKKIYSIFSQVFERIVSESGFEPKDWGMGGMHDRDSHKIFAKKFIPYLNIMNNCVDMNSADATKYCGSIYSNPSSYANVRLIDGTTVIFRLWNPVCDWKFGNSKQMQNVCGTISVDLNGSKEPNTPGQDLFAFYFTNYGIVPIGTQQDTKLTFNTYCDKNKTWGSQIGGYTNGMGCTAWIIYNENMEYLHCSGLDWSSKTKCK